MTDQQFPATGADVPPAPATGTPVPPPAYAAPPAAPGYPAPAAAYPPVPSAPMYSAPPAASAPGTYGAPGAYGAPGSAPAPGAYQPTYGTYAPVVDTSAARRSALRTLFVGLGILAIGLVITVGSWILAPGGHFLVLYGPVVFGVIVTIRGAIALSKAR